MAIICRKTNIFFQARNYKDGDQINRFECDIQYKYVIKPESGEV